MLRLIEAWQLFIGNGMNIKIQFNANESLTYCFTRFTLHMYLSIIKLNSKSFMLYLSEVQVVSQLAGVLGDLQVVAVAVALCGLGGPEEELVELRLVLDDEPGVGAGTVSHLTKRKHAFYFNLS